MAVVQETGRLNGCCQPVAWTLRPRKDEDRIQPPSRTVYCKPLTLACSNLFENRPFSKSRFPSRTGRVYRSRNPRYLHQALGVMSATLIKASVPRGNVSMAATQGNMKIPIFNIWRNCRLMKVVASNEVELRLKEGCEQIPPQRGSEVSNTSKNGGAGTCRQVGGTLPFS